MEFAIQSDYRLKLEEGEKRDKYLDALGNLKKKTLGHEIDGNFNCKLCARCSHQRLVQGLEELDSRS